MILASHGIIASQIQSFVGLLDLYPSAAAAYSVRKLRAAYTGSAIRVRRSSDNTEQNIGFDLNGNLDTSSLTSFCSGTNGFVTTWYDQSGNSQNATQTTASNQPQIVSSGSVLTLTGTGSAKPCLRFDGSNDFFTNLIPLVTSDQFSIYQVEKKTTSSSVGILFASSTSGGSPMGPLHFSNGTLYMDFKLNSTNTDFGFGNLSGNNYNLISGYMKNSTTNSIAYVNNSSFTFSSSASHTRVNNFSQIGARGAEFYSNTSTQEMIIYLSDNSNNNTAINTNINSYYGIY